MILSLVLFGSRARGDHRLSSDVDLLGIVDGGAIRDVSSNRGTSLYCYPFELILSNSKNGDLFVLHLVKEGIALHDTAGLFASIKDSFMYRESYASVIREASAVALFLLSRPQQLQTRAGRKRLIWGLRTIIIARAAEKKESIFSSAALAEFTRIPDLKNVIDKRFVVPVDLLCEFTRKVVTEFGSAESELNWPQSQVDQIKTLQDLGSVARATAGITQRRRKKVDASVETTSFYV